MAKNDRHVAGIDIGTSSVRVVIAIPTDAGGLDVVGIGRLALRIICNLSAGRLDANELGHVDAIRVGHRTA